MSEISIGRVRLPRSGRTRVGEKLAREAVFRLLGRLETGSITVHEGRGRYCFGLDTGAGPHAEVHVHDPSVYARMLSGGSIAAGETYMRGSWSSPDLVQVTRLFCANMAVLERFDASQSLSVRLALRLAHFFNRNTRAGSRDNISAHYDLGNDFFNLFLDPTMMYSSALFEEAGLPLETASVAKLDELCRRLELCAQDHLLEIGTGWGGLACFAARHYGCRVTTTTLSRAQLEHARARVAREGLAERVTLLLEDYRDLQGCYDKLVSVEMIEAVGHQYLPGYFRTLDRLLKPDGRLLIQAITITDQRYDQYRKSVDFIQRYIFPGGCLPSVSEMCRHLKEQTGMTLTRLHDYGLHYAETLNIWAERFRQAEARLKALGYGQDFQRLWAFYFAYCEGGFREGSIGLVHFEAAKAGARTCPDGSGSSC